MTLKLEVDGVPFDTYLSFSVSRSMENFSGSFSMTASDADVKGFPIKLGSLVKATINGFPVLTGYVEKTSPSIDSGSHSVTIDGRDITADIIDSTLDASSVEFTPPVTFETVINRVQEAIGTRLKVINNVPDLEPFGASDLVSCKAGDGAFAFLEKFARKRHVLLNTDGLGNITISRNAETEAPFSVFNDKDGNLLNNVLSSSATFDNSERFRNYVVVSQGNLTTTPSFGDEPDNDAVVSVKSEIIVDSEIRQGRSMVIVAEKNSTIAEAVTRAKWEANIRRARSRTYTAKLDGLVMPGTREPYPINRLVEISDEACSIFSTMLVKSASFSVSADAADTTLEFVSPDAYTLEQDEPEKKSKAKKKGSEIAPEFI